MTLTQITEKGIKDGEIVNADISSNTAHRIAGTKISPDFGSQAVSTTNDLSSGDITITGAAPKLTFTDSDDSHTFYIQSDGDALSLEDATNSTTKLGISNTGHITLRGNVTVNDGYLEVANANLYINENITHAGDGDTRIRFSGNDEISLETAGSNRLFINSTGNVGLNISTPQSMLELSAATDTVMGIELGRAGDSITASRYIGICQTNNATNLAVNSGFSGVEFGGPASTREGYVAFHTHDTGVGSGERMCIDKSGLVGVGTASPDRLIHAAGATPIFKLDSTNNEAYVQFKTASPSNESYIGLVDSDIIFQTSGANQGTVSKLRIDNFGHLVIVDGNLEVASGHGIDFSNVSDGSRSVSSNLLDDYEEGTFTPTIIQGIDNGSGGDPTYNINAGNYVKIGRLVQVSYFIQLNTTVGTVFGTGVRLHMGGLPFTIQAVSGQHNGFGSTAYHTIVNNVGDVPVMHYGSQHGTFIECYSGSNSIAPTNNTDQYGRYFIGGFTYHTNA